ncbi:MAG: helix-turn-helix domain-containing protein [Treponema sp.]|nr:helix-turn-helix domain-containing protein [Treponema sp.]
MPITIDEEMMPDIYYVVFRKCTPSWNIPEQLFNSCDFTYVVHGNGRYTIDGRDYDLAEGDLLYLPRRCVRAAVTFPDRLMHCFSVNFRLRSARNRDITLPFPVVSRIGRKEDIIHLLHELSFTWLNKQSGYVIKSRGLFLQILHRFLELIVYQADSPASDSRIAKVIRYMTLHYSEHISVKMMADMVGLNPTYFGVLFRQESSLSFNRYLIQIRVKNAENMLTSGEYKVGEVAEACGFTDVSHFYKQFKEIKGFPPSHCLPKKF